MSDSIQLTQLIGTEVCGYCSKLTECLTLDEDSSACEQCISDAFKEHWGNDDSDG